MTARGEQPLAEKGNRIPSLDGLRAISISFVVIDHMSRTQGFPLRLDNVNADRLSEALGTFGVRVFFVISGYLITSLLLGELKRRGSIDLSRFYFRRTMRIFIPYYALLAIVVLLQVPGLTSLSSDDILHAATYTMNYFPERSWDLGHAWSLSVEEQFYILWPATLLLLGRRRGLGVAAAFLVLAPIWRVGYFYLAPELVEYEVRYRFETVGDALACGCLLAGLSDWLGNQPLYRRCLSSKLFIFVPAGVGYAATLDPGIRSQLLVGISLQNVGIAVCVAWCVVNYPGRLGKLLNSRPFASLGLMSYSVYLWQQPLTNPTSNSGITRFPLNLVLLACVTLASYWLVERRALAWRKQLELRLFGVTEKPRDPPERLAMAAQAGCEVRGRDGVAIDPCTEAEAAT